MSCDCWHVKNVLFGPHYKKCRICRNNMCTSCSSNKIPVCRICELKETTNFEREDLIKLPMEKLLEIGEAFNITIDSDKLLKSQVVSLLLLSCKSPRKSPQTPKSSPGQTLSPAEITKDLMEFPSQNTVENQSPTSNTKTDEIVNISPEILKCISLGQDTFMKKPVKELLPIMKTMNMKSDEGSNEKQEIVHQNDMNETSDKLKINAQNAPCKPVAIGQHEILTIEDQMEIEGIADRPTIPLKQNSIAMKSIPKEDSHTRIKLNEITSSKAINDMTVKQLKTILKENKIGMNGLNEKWELAYRVLQLWHDFMKKDGVRPEILFENASLRVGKIGSPATEHRKNYIKTTKRRGIYISESESSRQRENTDGRGPTEPRCELQEDVYFSSKKKRLHDDSKPEKLKM